MITVTVDCNNDEITLDNGYGKPAVYGRSGMERGFRTSVIQAMLEELLNMLNHSGTELVRIDEDTRRTIGEW